MGKLAVAFNTVFKKLPFGIKTHNPKDTTHVMVSQPIYHTILHVSMFNMCLGLWVFFQTESMRLLRPNVKEVK